MREFFFCFILYINVKQNSIHGTIPMSFGSLKNLVISLEIKDNQISGMIPITIGLME